MITNEQIAELWRLKGDTLAGDLAVGIAHDDPNWADAPMLRKIAGPSGIIGDNGHGDEVILASGNPNFPALGAAWAAEAVAMHNALPDLLDEIERLTLERNSWKAEAEMERESNERLRAAVEAMKDVEWLLDPERSQPHRELNSIATWEWLQIRAETVAALSGALAATQPGEGEGER